jgi:hypothetical protein
VPYVAIVKRFFTKTQVFEKSKAFTAKAPSPQREASILFSESIQPSRPSRLGGSKDLVSF